MKRFAAQCLMLLTVAAPARAASIGLTSWDGQPPGTLADIYKLPADSGWYHGQTWGVGTYMVAFNGGLTAWRDATTITAWGEASGQPYDVLPPGAFASGFEVQLLMEEPWLLSALTPTGSDPLWSTGPQWVWWQTSATSWLWGLEDITVGRGDDDFQDLYGSLRYVGPLPALFYASAPNQPGVTPVPEPSLLVIVVALVAWGACRHGRRGREGTGL